MKWWVLSCGPRRWDLKVLRWNHSSMLMNRTQKFDSFLSPPLTKTLWRQLSFLLSSKVQWNCSGTTVSLKISKNFVMALQKRSCNGVCIILPSITCAKCWTQRITLWSSRKWFWAMVLNQSGKNAWQPMQQRQMKQMQHANVPWKISSFHAWMLKMLNVSCAAWWMVSVSPS